uniref:Uncharacterized protein n=1 Tax=Strigamia maritima TaxID=126957 RepID=T1IXZ4_STRMM
MQSTTITREAIGRSAAIGDLYDVRTDSFMDISILNDSIPEDLINTIKIAIPDVKCIDKETVKEKFEKLKIEPELRASILADLIPVEGYAKYFKHDKEAQNYVQKSVIYTNANLIEQLVLRKDKMEELISRDAIDENLGTHFVCAVTWGTKVVVSMERENSSDEDNVGDSLKQTLTALISSIQGVTQTLPDVPMSVDVFADVLPTVNPPNTLTETEDYVKKTLKRMQMMNKKKGRQLTYTLMPLWALNDYMFTSIPEEKIVLLDEETEINLCIERFEDIREALLQVSHVLKQFEIHATCIPVEQVREGLELKSKLINHETEMKSQLKKIIPAIRSGSKPTTSLEQLLEVREFNLLRDEMNAWMNQQNIWLQKTRFVEQLQQAGVQYVGLGTRFDDIKQSMTASNQQFYVLFFGVKLQNGNEDYWKAVKTFFESIGSPSRIAIDLDVRPELALKEVDANKIRLCLYQNGKYINFDAYATYLAEASKCLAQGYNHEKSEKPNMRVDLQLKCPGSLQGNCEEEKYVWHCCHCNDQISYGFDSHFYCHCGKAKCETFSFKCCSNGHDFGYMLFSPWDMKKLLSEIPPMDELNILVLGVTGVGKSTWLNAFVNYLTYPSLKEATQRELHSVTSSWFQLTDDENKVHEVQFGKDENEVHGEGRSATQDVRGHLFPIGNTLLRLIDTPGIGDVRGVAKDKENFANILAYLRTLKEIHGICILLKPNESKLHILFEFCIKELLTHLHRNALKNIVFCFTHSRTTFYKPGDTRVPLAELLKQNKIVLPLDPSTMYCMDNESFRFLCAVNQGVPFKDSVKNAFSESWNVTVEEINRLMEHIKSLEPHVIFDTISLNDARKNIICLTKPIADISANIQRNLTETEWKREMLLNSNARVEELAKQLYHDVTVLKSEPLSYPRTVCGSRKCVRYHSMANTTSSCIEYKTICHDHCQLTGVPVEIVGDKAIKDCWAMECGKSLYCRSCKCSWDQHLHIKYIQRAEIQRMTAQNVENQMSQKKCESQNIQDFIMNLEIFKKELEDEQQKIIEASVKFGRYLSKNAIVPYNDVIERYIDHLIEREKDNVAFTKNDELLKRLKAMQEMYMVEAEALKQAMKRPDAEELNVVEFQKLLRTLYSLKHNGKQLEDAFEQASKCEERKNEEWERFHYPKQRQGYATNFSSQFVGWVSKSNARRKPSNRQPTVRRHAAIKEVSGNSSQMYSWDWERPWQASLQGPGTSGSSTVTTFGSSGTSGSSTVAAFGSSTANPSVVGQGVTWIKKKIWK